MVWLSVPTTESGYKYILSLFALSQINSDSSNHGRSQTAYECKHHECWHTGHPKDYSNNPIARINQIFEQNQPSKRNKGKRRTN